VIAWLLVAALVGVLAGAACGFVIGSRLLPHTLARMSDAQLDSLADKVREIRDGTG
jgi:membrane protein DedA with SNARE-associated domain